MWIGDQIASNNLKTYYKSVIVGDEKIEINDYVLVEPRNPTSPSHVAKVIYMWENKNGMKQFHANWLHRGNDTILGETSDPIELFLSDECDDVPFKAVRSKCTVIFKNVPKNWAELGTIFIDQVFNTNIKTKNIFDSIIIGNMDLNSENEVKDLDGKTFFYQKRYTPATARFEDPLPDLICPFKEKSHRFCPACAHLREVEQFNTPKVCKVNTVHFTCVIQDDKKIGDQTLIPYSTISKDEKKVIGSETLPFRDIDTSCLDQKFTRIAVRQIF